MAPLAPTLLAPAVGMVAGPVVVGAIGVLVAEVVPLITGTTVVGEPEPVVGVTYGGTTGELTADVPTRLVETDGVLVMTVVMVVGGVTTVVLPYGTVTFDDGQYVVVYVVTGGVVRLRVQGQLVMVRVVELVTVYVTFWYAKVVGVAQTVV